MLGGPPNLLSEPQPVPAMDAVETVWARAVPSKYRSMDPLCHVTKSTCWSTALGTLHPSWIRIFRVRVQESACQQEPWRSAAEPGLEPTCLEQRSGAVGAAGASLQAGVQPPPQRGLVLQPSRAGARSQCCLSLPFPFCTAAGCAGNARRGFQTCVMPGSPRPLPACGRSGPLGIPEGVGEGSAGSLWGAHARPLHAQP